MDDLEVKAKRLGFHAMVAQWNEYANQPWVPKLLEQEEVEKKRRSLERRIKEAKLEHFKAIVDFDWSWPKRIDREQIEDLFTLKFLEEPANVMFIGQNGVGKTMLAQNIAFEALQAGHDVRFIKCSQLLNELSNCEGPYARRRCLSKYCGVDLLVIDEVGYLSYDNCYADLLYEVISGRYQKLSTIVTTNRTFKEWTDVFPNAACVVTLVDRLIHKAEIVAIDAGSYRHREAHERAERKAKQRQEKPTKKRGNNNDTSSSSTKL
jgi:DNA replication protein DnaC